MKIKNVFIFIVLLMNLILFTSCQSSISDEAKRNIINSVNKFSYIFESYVFNSDITSFKNLIKDDFSLIINDNKKVSKITINKDNLKTLYFQKKDYNIISDIKIYEMFPDLSNKKYDNFYTVSDSIINFKKLSTYKDTDILTICDKLSKKFTTNDLSIYFNNDGFILSQNIVDSDKTFGDFAFFQKVNNNYYLQMIVKILGKQVKTTDKIVSTQNINAISIDTAIQNIKKFYNGQMPSGILLENKPNTAIENKNYYVFQEVKFITDNKQTGDGHTINLGWFYVDTNIGTVFYSKEYNKDLQLLQKVINNF